MPDKVSLGPGVTIPISDFDPPTTIRLEALEPAAAEAASVDDPTLPIRMSIAISLKRIADALTKPEGGVG